MIDKLRFLIAGICCLFAACADDQGADKNLNPTSVQQVVIVDLNEDLYSLEVHGRGWIIKNTVEKDGGRLPRVDDLFSIQYCERVASVFMLSEEADTAITYGKMYKYVIWDIAQKKILDTIIAGNVRDKMDDSIISNNWEEVLKNLKSGVKTGCENDGHEN